MGDDIKKLRPLVDVLVVSMHSGVHHVPAMIAMYQKEAAYHAVDNGADLVLQHHAHLLKGIEIYNGKAIFYGLGNFAVEHTRHAPGQSSSGGGTDRTFRKFYGVKSAPGSQDSGFLPDARKTVITKAYIRDKKIQKVTYIPAYINPDMEPEVVMRKDAKAQQVFDYVAKISQDEDLNVAFSWEGDEVLVRAEK